MNPCLSLGAFLLQAGLSDPTATTAADAAAAATINADENADADAKPKADATANSNGSRRTGASLATAPAAGKATKQVSLKAFFAPSARGEEHTNG